MNQAELLASQQRNVLWVFGSTSLVAIILGAVAMVQSDVTQAIWIRNPTAWVVAAGVSNFLARRGVFGAWLLPAALLVISLSFLGAGQEGVHRWLELGPVQLNAAALVLPAAIMMFDRVRPSIAVTCFVLIGALLAWQPDRSQLLGFSVAAVILAYARFGWRGLILSTLGAGAGIAFCLARPDPLDPVAHVEGIMSAAWVQSPALAVATGMALAGAALSPLLVWSAHPGAVSPLALAAYLAVTAAAFLFGAYPVPLAGYGLSFVIGWWLGIAVLSGRSSVNSLTAA